MTSNSPQACISCQIGGLPILATLHRFEDLNAVLKFSKFFMKMGLWDSMRLPRRVWIVLA
jgi:hypothetical protein